MANASLASPWPELALLLTSMWWPCSLARACLVLLWPEWMRLLENVRSGKLCLANASLASPWLALLLASMWWPC